MPNYMKKMRKILNIEEVYLKEGHLNFSKIGYLYAFFADFPENREYLGNKFPYFLQTGTRVFDRNLHLYPLKLI